jgi:hypothetical protein
MTWFDALTGFEEQSPEHVRSNLVLDNERSTSKINGKTMICGRLETPSLAELRESVSALGNGGGKLEISEVVADVRYLHFDATNEGTLFQVASQLNLLEMVSPNRVPEDGVGIYEYDGTQGPACAIAAGAGTIYRNYFVPVNGQIGQEKWRKFYIEKRPHSSLDYQTPKEMPEKLEEKQRNLLEKVT